MDGNNGLAGLSKKKKKKIYVRFHVWLPSDYLWLKILDYFGLLCNQA